MPRRVAIVCGGRDFIPTPKDQQNLVRALRKHKITWVRDGKASGADEFAHQVADRMGLDTDRIPANWKEHGRAAGPLRNQRMLDAEPRPSLVIAFPGGSGTDNMIALASRAGIRVVNMPKQKARYAGPMLGWR